eukprot:2980962-Rhodomonas_salina.1
MTPKTRHTRRDTRHKTTHDTENNRRKTHTASRGGPVRCRLSKSSHALGSAAPPHCHTDKHAHTPTRVHTHTSASHHDPHTHIS